MTCEHWQHGFLDYTQVAFWDGQGEEYDFKVPGDHFKHCFLVLIKVEFWCYQEAENDLNVIQSFESSLYRIDKSRTLGRSRAENDFKVPFENWNHRLFHFIQISFWVGQEVEN